MAKTIQELYSEKRKSEQQNNGSRTVKDIFWEKNGGDVADEITSRVNTWMQNSSNFNANFQNRYENGNDSFRSDSSDWLSKITTQKNNFDKEASNIKSMLDAYKDYLNPEWSNSIKTALDQSSARQSEILKYSSDDNAYWSQWDSADAYKQYVDYKKEYDKTTVAKKYADFEEYSKKGAEIENPTMSEAEGFIIIGDKHIGGKDVGNEVTYSRDNWEDIAQIEAEGQGNVVGRSIYHYMTDDEVDIYNYYLAKYGKEKADEYIVSIEDYLNQRKGGQIADNVKDAPALQFMFGAAAGLDQSMSGLRTLFADENSAKPSALQYASSEIREDLSETGAKTPDWMGGNSVGQMAYDAITASANMLPSILVSTVTANPTLGAITLGASASGNAYAEMLNLGYDKAQARTYSVLVGASEAFLQNAIGGITALGAGKFGAKGLTELALKKIDNAFARVAIQLGGTMLSEGFEESVQEVIDPWLQSIVFGTDFEAPSASDVLYSGLLGAITGLAFEGAGIVSTEVNNYVTGRNISKSEADVKRLAEIGTMFSPETTAGQIASKINDKTGAYTIGRLFNEVGATLSEQNISDISSALVERGFDEKSAQTLARAFDADVEGLSFTDKEKLALEKNDVLSGVIREKLIGENSTVYQRTEGYNTVLYNLAKEKSGSKLNTAAVSDTAEESEQGKPYSGMNVFEVENRIKAAMTDSASTEATGAHETETANKYSYVNENSVQSKYESNNDGVTTLKSTGESVEIKDIASMKNGDVRLNLTNGETVSANDVNFASMADAVMYEAVADMGVNPATAYAIVKGYDAGYGTPIQNYMLGIEEAYNYGKVGYPVAKINSKGFFNDLTEAQKRLGYDLGASEANAMYTAQQNAINEAKTKSTEINKKNGYKKSGRVIYDIDKSTKNSMSERQRASAKALEYVASALGVDIHLFQSLTDENGKHIGANGWFDPSDNSIHIDISAGQNGEGVMLFTAAHELTHFIKAWSPAKFKTFADFLVSQYGEKGVDVNALIQNQIDKAKRNGRSIDRDTAYEEMIADSCQKMLTDSNAIKKLAKLKAQDKSLWTKIKKYVSELIARIRKAYEGMTPYSEEARIVSEQMLDVAEKLNTLFNDALIDAGETYSEVRNAVGEDAVLAVNDNGEFLMAKASDGTRLFNDRTWTDGGRDVLKASLEREGFSEEDVNAALTIMDAKHDLVKQLGKEFSAQDKVNNATITTDVKNGKSVLTALVSNGEYPVNIDLMMVCKKRVAYQRVINRLCETGLIENATLDSLAIAEINKILGKNGFETACLGCFVESRRIRIQEWAETICSEWNGLVDKMVGKGKAESFGFSKEKSEFLNDLSDDYINQLSDELESAGEINYGRTTVVKKMEKLLDTIPSMRKHLSVADLITPSGRANLKSVSAELNSLVACRYGSNTPKIVQDFNPYNSELALYDKYPKDYSSLREYLYAIGGARMQSFSDFIVENWFDYCQIVADLASRKLPMHTYTKEIALAKLFGLTGIKINMSLIPDIDRSLPREYAGLTKNANGEYELIFADKDRNKATGGKSYMQSINFADAVALQNDPRYSSNVGTIAVGISDNHILMMLDDSRIRMIIPYHSSGMNPIFAKLVGTDYYTDYTNYQNTGVKHLVDEKGNIRNIELSKTQIKNLTKYEFNEVLQRTGDAKAAAREYLDWCADSSQHSIRINGTTYNAVLTPKFERFSDHENYYKLLEDFNTYDSVTGNPAPQGDVTQTYPDDFEDILRSELSNMAKYRSKTDPKFEGAMSEIESYLKNHTKSDTLAYAKDNGIKLSKKDEKITAKDKQKEENLKKLSDRDKAPVFYSQMGKVIDGIKSEKIGANGVVPYLKGKGVKDEEIKWSGIEEFLEGKKSVKKSELQEFVAGSMLQIDEQMSGTAVFVADDGNTYNSQTEFKDAAYAVADKNGISRDRVKFIIDTKNDMDAYAYVGHPNNTILTAAVEESEGIAPRWDEYKLDGGENYREIVFTMPDSSYSNEMMRTHWGDDAEGVLAHARVQDFDVNGKKMLFIEEIQSDWHNEGRSKGYESYGDSSDIVVCTIREYDSKDGDIIQVIYNKDDGSISASNGDDLGIYYADSIDTATKYAKQMLGEFDTYKERGTVADAPFKDTYQEYVIKRLLRMAAENGYDSIGWTTAEIQEERWSSDYAEGYRIEYDQDIPKFLNKYGKKWGGKVGKEQVDTGTASKDVWSFSIPDSMKESVLYEGQPMYSDRDIESADNRTILANALKSATMNQREKQILIEYKKNIDKIGIEERDLAKINAKIKELSFSKGKRDTKQLAELKESAVKIRNRINIYDKKLLYLEATKPLKDVIKREREIAYKSAIEKGNAQINELRQKKAEAISDLRQKFKDQNARKKERMDTTSMRHKVIDVVNDLNQYLLRGTKEKHVPIGLQKPVAELLSIINMDTQNADERVAEYDKRIAAATDEITKDALIKSRDRIKEQGENLAEKIASLKSAYADIVNSDDPIIANSHDEVIDSIIDKVSNEIGNTPIRNMSLEQLESLYKMVTAVRKSITTANKAFKARNKENIAILGNNTMEEVLKAGGKHDYSLKSLESAKNFAWNMLKPTTAMKIIGSSTLKELFDNVRAGEDTWAVDVDEATKYFQNTSQKYGYDSWDFDSKKTFTAKNGKPFKLSLEQIMSLYAYSKRPQADKHLEMGGIVFDKDIEVKMKTRSGISLTYNPNTADAYNIAPETLGEIIGTLTKEQKQFVDEMQKYLSVDMGAKGNEVSRALYDINLFNEKNYFPLKSAPEYMAKAREQQQGDIKIKNSGFSKETVPKASNPIVLSNFMDVWSGHVNDMSMYHAFVLPLEDFYKVYNYKTPIHDEYGTESVQMALRNAYGSSCTAYIEQLLKDINGGARADRTTGFINKAMSLMKKGSVFASASVVIQQLSAIGRAFAYINPKYFATNPLSKNHKAEWEEVKKYAPVAIIKEMGRFDTNVGRQTADWIKSRTYETKAEKVKALVTDSAYRDDVLSAPAAMADEITWCYIWKAVKNEIKSTTDLEEGSNEFLEAVGRRFTEVIVNTQVYDSVLTRSGMMRSKDTGMKMATAFNAEPMTSLNMIVEGIVSAKRGDKSFAKASVGAVTASVILNSILVSIVYAARDDDEDETYLEKYIGSMTSEVIDGLNPVTYIPFIKDIWSIAQGYDVERLDMSVASDLWKSVEGLFSDSKTPLQKVESFSGTVAALFGLPVKNILRDARGLFNVVKTATSGIRTNAYGIGKSVKGAIADAIPLGDKFIDTDSKSEELYKAVISGNEERIKRAKAQYKDEDAVNTALRKELRNQDSRISEAAHARIDGNISEYARITREIVAEGIFSQDEVVKAINAEISAIKSESASEETGVTEETEETGYTSIYSYSDINSAISNGDINLALSIIDDLEASGKKKSSIKASVTSYLKPLYKDAYEAKNKDEMKRIREMMYDLGIYGRKSEIIETVKGWLKY